MTVKTLSLHEAIYSNRDPREVIAFDKDTTYHLYDLQLMVKALSVFLSMSKEKRFAIMLKTLICLQLLLLPAYMLKRSLSLQVL